MGEVQTRQDISLELKWRLEDIYATEQEWEEDLTKIKAGLDGMRELRATIKSAQELLVVLRKLSEAGLLLNRVVCYAFMRKDEDNANPLYQRSADRALAASVELESALAFVEPEILTLDAARVRVWIEELPELGVYRHYLENILRKKAHTLPVEQEELLASAGELAEGPGQIFRMFNNADLKFPEVSDDSGQIIELTHGRYIRLLESQNRKVRQGAFQALYETYGAWKNTLGATYLAAVKKELYFARARKYDSALDAALDADNVPVQVYTNLISSIHDHLPLLHRYVRLRKELLGLDELHMYDLHVPLVADQDIKVPRERAVQMVKAGLHPLGGQYLQDLNGSFVEGWIDWLENRGKTSGAYSWGAYGTHPYVLLNYQDSLSDVFTLAHELGHAMHTFYSNQNQEFINSEYTIFVAEVASTLNEALLMDDLLNKTDDPKKRAYLLNHYLEQFRGTVFRQTMFAEFELIVHGKVADGEALTATELSEIYHELVKSYFGSDAIADQLIALEWARIPHFYRPFYVYKYATGFSAAIALAQQILEQGAPARARYLTFLGSGGSDYPLCLLKHAGVDLSEPAPIVQAMQVFQETLTDLEKVAKV